MVKGYHSLSKEKYLHKPKMVTQEEIDQIYQSRLNGFSTFKTNLYPLLTDKVGNQTNKYPLFFVYLPEIVRLENTLRENSHQIKDLAKELSGIAKQQFLNSLLVSEITYTNKIEGVETDRGEISTIIRENEKAARRPSYKRLQSTIKMYQETQNEHLIKIEKLRDFRNIYDNLLEGEIEPNKLPNGKLFRDEFVARRKIKDWDALHTVHVSPQTEEAINEALTSLIEFMNNNDLPPIYKSLITHFFFENTYPFLDGNGRMGRYLLSTYISHKYDYFTGFSVATAIHSRVQTYYRIFEEADQAENYAELTFFIVAMLKLLVAQQEEIVATLSDDKDKLEQVTNEIKKKIGSLTDEYDKEAIYSVLFYLGESKLFAGNKELGILDSDIIQFNSKEGKISIRRTKEALNKLEQMNWIKKIGSRPKQHELSI